MLVRTLQENGKSLMTSVSSKYAIVLGIADRVEFTSD